MESSTLLRDRNLVLVLGDVRIARFLGRYVWGLLQARSEIGHQRSYFQSWQYLRQRRPIRVDSRLFVQSKEARLEAAKTTLIGGSF